MFSSFMIYKVLHFSSPVSVVEADMVDAMNMLSIILPATPFTNMGQELGIIDKIFFRNQTLHGRHFTDITNKYYYY